MRNHKLISGKKWLSGLITLLLILSLCIGSLAESGTVFPWRQYVLDVTLATSDPALVDINPAPKGGALVLVELTDFDQGIAKTDIDAYKEEFSLKDRDGIEYIPYQVRLRGISFVDGEFSIHPYQKTLELIYQLTGKDQSAFEGAYLMVDTEKVGERIRVTLSKAPSARGANSASVIAAAPEEIAPTLESPKVSADPGPAEITLPSAATEPPVIPVLPNAMNDIDAQLDTLMNECAASAKNEWQRSIYEAGLEDVVLDGETITFFLRSFNPGLKSLGTYADGQADYVLRMMDNAKAYDLSSKLILKDGVFTAKSVAAFKSKVAAAAETSQTAFGEKRVLVAIKDWLFPTPAKTVKKAEDILATEEFFRLRGDQLGFYSSDDSFREYAPLYYGQASQTLSTKKGPHHLVMNCLGISPEELLQTAQSKAFNLLYTQPHANEKSEDEIKQVFISELAAAAKSLRPKAAEKFSVSLDADTLAQEEAPEDYSQYINRYQYEDTFENLVSQVEALPDYPAQAFPPSGRLFGSNKGTKIIIKAPKDEFGRYIELCEYYTDKLTATGFIGPGKSCTFYAPKGDYIFKIYSGETWYGEEVKFSEDSYPSFSELFEVASSNYYHTVTLQTMEDGNFSVYDYDPRDFL